METLKKIGRVAGDILLFLVFAASVILIIANLSVDKSKGEQPNVFGYTISSVQSESMSGCFEKGALVLGHVVDESTEIEVGTIISFYQKVNGVVIINTHRVVAISGEGQSRLFQTQGDNRAVCPAPDPEWKTVDEIVAVYRGHIPAVGGFIDFLRQPVGFVLILVVPMLAFIGWQIYKLIAIYLQAKHEQMLKEATGEVSDEAKDAIIREYLAKMQKENADGQTPVQEGEEPKDNTEEENA